MKRVVVVERERGSRTRQTRPKTGSSNVYRGQLKVIGRCDMTFDVGGVIITTTILYPPRVRPAPKKPTGAVMRPVCDEGRTGKK